MYTLTERGLLAQLPLLFHPGSQGVIIIVQIVPQKTEKFGPLNINSQYTPGIY